MLIYINNRFNLVDNNNNLLPKKNAKEIVEFINNNIININAELTENNSIRINNKDLLYVTDNSYETYEIFDTDKNNSLGSNLVNYISSVNLRLENIKINIKKAKDNKDLKRLNELEELYEKEKNNVDTVTDITSLVSLFDKGQEDLELVDSILKRPMNSEDILYVEHIINFWKNAKAQIFDERANSSEELAKLYGQLESLAEQKGIKLFEIKKNI